MIRNKKIVIASLSIIAILLIGIVVGYSLLSTSLTSTNNSILQNALTWNIGFQTGTVNGVVVANNSNNVQCGTATVNSTTIYGINATLSKPGDECSYTFTILNQGNIAGRISSINITKPNSTTCTINGSTMVCGSVTYQLHYNTYNSTSLVAVDDTIAAMSGSTPTSKTIVLTLEYTGDTAATTDYNQSGFTYNLVFSQY